MGLNFAGIIVVLTTFPYVIILLQLCTLSESWIFCGPLLERGRPKAQFKNTACIKVLLDGLTSLDTVKTHTFQKS